MQDEDVDVGTIGTDGRSDVVIEQPDPLHDVRPLRSRTRTDYIHCWARFVESARGSASRYEVDAEQLLSGLVAAAAADAWGADFLITRVRGLRDSTGGSYRQVQIVDEEDGLLLLALFLRQRGRCYIAGQPPYSGELPPFLMYRAGTLAALAGAAEWAARWPNSKRIQTNDWAGMAFYDNPARAILDRFSNALRLRDQVLCEYLAMGGNESNDLVLLATENLMVQLSGTLDGAAAALAQQFTSLPGASQSNFSKLHHAKFAKALSEARPSLSSEYVERWSNTSRLISLIRNQVHSHPHVPVAGDNEIWLILPSAAQRSFHRLADALGGAQRWGALLGTREVGLIDPWFLSLQSVEATCSVIREIAESRLMFPPKVEPSIDRWPWNKSALDSAARVLALSQEGSADG